MKIYKIAEDTYIGYGGPPFDIDEFIDDFNRKNYQTYRSLYEDVQNELDLMKSNIVSQFRCRPEDLLWFESSIDPKLYTPGMTIETVWKEDYDSGIRYLEDMNTWLAQHEPDGEGVPEEELKKIDQTTYKCIRELMMYDWQIDDNWSFDWGPYAWYPENPGEWSRCRDIAISNEDYPVAVLVNGKMVDGAHRLTVAIHNRLRYYACVVGIPPNMLKKNQKY